MKLQKSCVALLKQKPNFVKNSITTKVNINCLERVFKKSLKTI